ncbi:MAG: hypothetical protein AVDCRST_MAG70-1432 [uncultured Thermomicrobiales bacterium]|uniref:RNA polymerase sigma-70 region 2 domain-containing protein n=1 Tax=uncultured Thermomicrobiales bacterium TaxID=1645740 RepID=A0A6J4UTV8_9BACT|nr:MAG: hypothetical protein AVDCRST_MAG70-1432 [uncultured Thermomicrobiales bacterium]
MGTPLDEAGGRRAPDDGTGPTPRRPRFHADAQREHLAPAGVPVDDPTDDPIHDPTDDRLSVSADVPVSSAWVEGSSAGTDTVAGGPALDDGRSATDVAAGIGNGRVVAPIAWQTVSPELDARMVTLARLAQAGDREARDRLYSLFAPRIARYARRFAGDGWRLDPAWDGDDLTQEGYLIFIDLVASWPGGPSFAAYALGYLPWRLRNAVRRLNGPRPRAFPAPAAALAELADHSAGTAEAIVLLETVAAGLPAPDGEVLLWRVRDGEPVGVIAARLGISRRTVSRSWQRTVTTLRESFRPVGREAEGA